MKPTRAVKFFCGILAREPSWLDAARESLAAQVSPLDEVSDVWPFDQTEYYARQMGTGLLRQFVAFAGTGDPAELAQIKLRTNALEGELAARLAADVPRPVNLDPGYVALDKLVLATTKDYSHRLYIGSGIYAEVTLRYEKGAWRAWPWTYPDYGAQTYHRFFIAVRNRLRWSQNGSGGFCLFQPPACGQGLRRRPDAHLAIKRVIPNPGKPEPSP